MILVPALIGFAGGMTLLVVGELFGGTWPWWWTVIIALTSFAGALLARVTMRR